MFIYGCSGFRVCEDGKFLLNKFLRFFFFFDGGVVFL